MKIHDIAGWIGVGLILIGYIFVTFNVVEGSSVSYSLINLFGAAGILWSSYVKRDYQPVALNVVWLLVALIGITQYLLS